MFAVVLPIMESNFLIATRSNNSNGETSLFIDSLKQSANRCAKREELPYTPAKYLPVASARELVEMAMSFKARSVTRARSRCPMSPECMSGARLYDAPDTVINQILDVGFHQESLAAMSIEVQNFNASMSGYVSEAALARETIDVD
ncbi:hypothetical protein [Babesia ovata]|uniref:Uncharacterized protein n=1 Tax=Babesia ovata TaxID=189622 RepID=A0A2H6K6T2_9APIC|nr:hypothetical protein [Babesia ovata]GBE58689.1 hypothetical protein [Babesia ovata]